MATRREKSQAHSESFVLRNGLAGLALETKLIRLQRQLQAKGWGTQPRAPAGQPNGGEWVQGSGGGQWASLHEHRPGGSSPEHPPALTDSTTLEDGTRVLSIRVHVGRRSFDEQHTVTAPDGESRIFETSGATQTILDGQTGDVLSRSTVTATDFVAEPLVQTAFLPAVPLAIEGALAAIQSARTLELALSLLTVLSARKNGFGAVLGLTAHEYALNANSRANIPFANYPPWKTLMHVALGEISAAQETWKTVMHRYVTGTVLQDARSQRLYDQWCLLTEPLMADDRAALARLLHGCEASSVIGTKLESSRLPTPFPLELGTWGIVWQAEDHCSQSQADRAAYLWVEKQK